MKVLVEGRINNSELADWFGVSVKTLTNNKQKKLEELKLFAEFYEDKGKVIITKVLNSVYSKQGSENYKKVKDKVDEVWDESGLDSCKRVGEEIYDILTNEDENFSLAPGSVYNYTIKGRNELYGKPFMSGGSLGSCSYLWCKRDKETGAYSMLTEEEQRIKQDLQTKYFGDATEKQVLVKAMVEAGEISKEEAWEVLEDMTNMNTGNFMGFLKELQAAIGCQVIKGTMVERLEDKSVFE